MRYSGNVPNRQKLRQMLAESGFYDHVEASGGKPKSNGYNQILRHHSDKVESERSGRLLEKISKVIALPDFERDGIQSTVVEGMTNTENHASDSSVKERWWLSAYVDKVQRKVYFCFVDNGVGIFESIKHHKIWPRLMNTLGLSTRAQLLRQILNGDVRSSTGLGYRGRGLPNIAKRLRRKQLSRLIIISNDVYADLEQDHFRMMDSSFRGTLLYWEYQER